MNIDLFLLGLVVLFAILGAISGAAKQISRLIAAVAAGIIARLLGPLAAPPVAKALQTSGTAGTVIASLVLFFLGFLLIRWVANDLLLRVLAGKDMTDRGLDRSLGFVLGGLRIGAIAWFVLCALAFLEDNVSIAGKRLALAPKGSVLFQLARHHNLFALAEVPGLHNLVDVARAASDPKQAEALKKSPAFTNLKKDPHFRSAIDTEAFRAALETGDYRAMMQNADVLKLLSDPAALQQLEAAADATNK